MARCLIFRFTPAHFVLFNSKLCYVAGECSAPDVIGRRHYLSATSMTQTFTIALFLASLISACASPDPEQVFDEKKIIDAVNTSFLDLANAAKSLELDLYFSFFDSKRFTSLNTAGTVTHTFKEFEHETRESSSTIVRYTSLTFSNVKLTVLNPTTVILVNEYEAELVLAGGQEISASGAGTQVWSNNDGAWQLVSISSSVTI